MARQGISFSGQTVSTVSCRQGDFGGWPVYATGLFTDADFWECFAVSPYERESTAVFAEPNTPRDDSAIRHRLAAACRGLGLGHVTPRGLRSCFVTQPRESGLSDEEIAMLIGDTTGPAIIALTYGDVRPDHLLKQAQRIRLTVQSKVASQREASSIKGSNTSPDVSSCAVTVLQDTETDQQVAFQGV
jgi:hypothetical protein